MLHLQKEPKPKMAAHMPNMSIQLDGLHHWPTYMPDDEKGRYKYPECEGITTELVLHLQIKLFQRLSYHVILI